MNSYEHVKDISRHYRTRRSPAFYMARDLAGLILGLGGVAAFVVVLAEVFGG